MDQQQFVGLDVSQAETAVCVIDAAGATVWQGKYASDPEAIAGAYAVGRRTSRASRWRPAPCPLGIGAP